MELTFSVFKKKCKYIDLKVGVGKMKIKTLYVNFFKCSFIKRGSAVIFELHGGTIFSLVKFKFQSMSYKIEQALVKITKKSAEKAMK